MKLTMIGTGVRAPSVVRGLAERGRELGVTELALHDTDGDRLETMAALCGYVVDQHRAGFRVRAEHDPRDALRNARFVYTAIRVGQERGRALDEEVALRHGVLGQETTGPGGFAMAMRTIPVMLDYARLLEDVAPDAFVINFTNPVGMIVQALADHSAVRCVGICDGPPDMKRSVARLLGVPGDEILVEYFGLNHCGWVRRVLVDGHDRMPEVLDRYEELQGLDDAWGLFEPELVRTLGLLPMEYLYFYYARDRVLDHIRASGGTRGEQIAKIYDSLWPALHERARAGDLAGGMLELRRAGRTRGETYFARERGEPVSDKTPLARMDPPLVEGHGYGGLAIAVLTALIGHRRLPLILDVPNRGALADLDETDVVEVTCFVDRNGAHPLAQGAVPEVVRGLLRSVKSFERLTVRAAVEGSQDQALRALVAHPLVGSFDRARAILDDYTEVHDGSFPLSRR